MRVVEPLPRSRRLVRWVTHGRVPVGQRSYTCDACGMGASVGALYSTNGRMGRRLRELHGRRAMQPVPRFYAVMALAGTVVGAAWSALLSWPWWVGPLAGVAGGWAFMTSTAFWHPRRPRGRPRRYGPRHEQDLMALFEDPPLPLYELVRWDAWRFVGGSVGDGRDVSALTLAFADLTDAGPEVRITTSAGGVEQGPPLEDELDSVLAPLTGHESDEPGAPADEPVDSTAAISVDGSVVMFQLVSCADRWAARADLDGHAVLIAARGVDRTNVEIRRVVDTEPYIRGWAEFKHAKWGLPPDL